MQRGNGRFATDAESGRGAGTSPDLRPKMNANESTPAEGERSDGGSEEELDEFIGFRVSEDTKRRVEWLAYEKSGPGSIASLSEVAREALARGLDEIEDGGE